MIVNLTPAKKLKRDIIPVMDKLKKLMRDFDAESGAPAGMMDADMRCRVVAGICHDLQLDGLTVATLMMGYLAVIEENCPDCKRRREARK